MKHRGNRTWRRFNPWPKQGFVDTASNGGGRSRELVASETGFSWTRCQGGTRSRSHVWGCRGRTTALGARGIAMRCYADGGDAMLMHGACPRSCVRRKSKAYPAAPVRVRLNRWSRRERIPGRYLGFRRAAQFGYRESHRGMSGVGQTVGFLLMRLPRSTSGEPKRFTDFPVKRAHGAGRSVSKVEKHTNSSPCEVGQLPNNLPSKLGRQPCKPPS